MGLKFLWAAHFGLHLAMCPIRDKWAGPAAHTWGGGAAGGGGLRAAGSLRLLRPHSRHQRLSWALAPVSAYASPTPLGSNTDKAALLDSGQGIFPCVQLFPEDQEKPCFCVVAYILLVGWRSLAVP